MKRNIRFRGLEINSNTWYYGDLLQTKYNAVITTGVFHLITNSTCEVDHIFEVKIESIGQFTGLKDCNNNDIYEGDKLDNDSIIEFRDGCFFANEIPLALSASHRLIIGNIHEA